MKIRLFLVILAMNSASVSAQYTMQGYGAFFPSEKEGTVMKNGQIYQGSLALAAHKEFEANTLIRITNLDNGKVTTAKIVEQLHPAADPFLMVSTAVGNSLGMSRFCMAQLSIEPYEDEDASTYGVVVTEFPTAPNDGTVTLPDTHRMRSFDDLDQSINYPVPVKPTNANMRVSDNRNIYDAKPEATTPPVTATPAPSSTFGQTVNQARTAVNTVGQVAGQIQNRVNNNRPQTPVAPPMPPPMAAAPQPATTPTNQPGYAPVYIPQAPVAPPGYTTPVYQPQTPVVAPVATPVAAPAAPVPTNLNFRWTVQVGVFSTPQAANNQMATVGQGSWYQEVNVNGRTMYRVNFNKFIDKATADAAKLQLQQRTGIVGLSKEIQ
jgi:rare lipoprotein A (peptidoglycan hydrolase)